jgi:AcrR family transcriptional regulator
LRERQAAATRRSITEAAHELFQEHGWATTTLPMIATQADVSADTIYAAFGTKSALRVQLYGIDCRLLTLFRTTAETLAINIDDLRAGVYILRVMDEKGHQVFQDKLIKL